MSTLERMGIQGIRSFGPDEVDFQSLKFFTPLTLILGPNGTGKTTIIECLKYATTGDMPPGSKGAGAAFIHDPKLCKEREIKGQIRLMIHDVSGAKLMVTRSMNAKLKDSKGKKIEMKTLDGVLTRFLPDGEKQSITSRCADLNIEMIGALGVSKAVLENVIFCHQEDSNWPLSEGKTVKEKFDAIFASTRYTKVLDEIKKLKQAQDQEIKECKKEQEYLKQLKTKAEELRNSLDDIESKFAASVDSVEKINEELEPVRAELLKINTHQTEIFKLQTSKQKFVSEKEHIEKSMKDLKEKIKENFTGSTTELKKELRDFSEKVQEKKDELSEQENQQDRLASELDKLAKTKSNVLMEKGKLEKEAEINAENIKKRDAKIFEVAAMYDFEGFSEGQEISDELYQRFFEFVKEKLTSLMALGKRKKAEFEEKENRIQEKIDALKENKTKLEHGEKMHKDTIAKNETEIKDINRKLTKMITSADRLESLKSDLNRVENQLHEVEASLNVDDARAEIASLDKQKKLLDASISELNTEINRLTKQSAVQTQLDMLISNQQEKESTIERLRQLHEDSIVSLLGHIPLDNLREAVSDYISNQTEAVKKTNLELNKQKTLLSSKQAEKNSLGTQLRQKEDELRTLEDKIYNVCESQDLDEEFNEVQKNLTQAQEEKGSLLGADHMIKKYIRNLEKNNPCCPLCTRGFQQAQEVRELILKLQEQLRKVPINIKKADEDVEKYQQKYDAIMQLKPLKEKSVSLKEIDIPELKSKIKKLDDELKSIKDIIQTKEDEVSIQETDLQIAKGFHPDVIDMDRRRGEVRELERKIEAQRALLLGGSSNRQIEQVMKEREEKQLELDTINRTLDSRRDKLSDFQEQTQKLRSKVHSLQSEKLGLEGELQQKIKLEERKTTLASDNKNYQRDIDEAKSQIRPIDSQIQKLLEEKGEVTNSKDKMMENARADVETVKNKGTSVKNLNTEIKNYNQSGKLDKLKVCLKKEKELDAEKLKKGELLEELSVAVKKITNEISNQQIRERELQDILLLRNKEEEVKSLEVKIAELQTKLGGLDVKTLEKDRQALLRKETELNQKRSTALGRQQGFEDQIESVKNDLNSDMYKEAEKKYKTKVIEIKTTEIVNMDLQKYYSALDKAIMMYHKTKMEEINVIIQELWKNTYRGNDIETILIQSEVDETTAGAMKNRRTYIYRVVMRRNGIDLDMRGRCSAGQKVLASIVIRLALAETFCTNCGILALDEPTTNLDRANIESLAIALVSVIKERQSQKHFQLIIITHDEDFVELLGRSEYVDEYIQVSKNPDGFSRLKVKRVEELHSS
ncbi:DNA repair protein RAD50 [Biomphalaria pfeifferi]|uniref:DNA repair protein RAD50 n=1 Tax=Biomphalaria pfeifferi TaxID=112525 RepID=A0AAD8C1G0_BIOPF|nr:DNA repair protein RAD50 [Biomphalaria pfeifferi]